MLGVVTNVLTYSFASVCDFFVPCADNEKESLITLSGFGRKTGGCAESEPIENASAKDIQTAVAALASATRIPSTKSSGLMLTVFMLSVWVLASENWTKGTYKNQTVAGVA